VRAGEETQLGVIGLEPEGLQLRLTAGALALDLRSLAAGRSLQVRTPNAALRVEQSGSYRVEVAGDTTTFTSRRGGRATVTPTAGEPVVVAASEELVVSGSGAPELASTAAPELDAWDRWNTARTDGQLDAVSARYVPAGVYGVHDLDLAGDWRVFPAYGAVWVPHRVGVGWAPYSTGRWMWDPWYGWTWVDDARWGWATFHHGRWLYLSGRWSWCPGPLGVRPYYAPALVAFYGRGPSYGRPRVGWVALGWGEPLIPWWGPARLRRRAVWAGWGGPRLVNQVVVESGTLPAAEDVRLYRNARVPGAIVEIERDRFGRRSSEALRFGRTRPGRLSPLHGRMDVGPDRSSLLPQRGPAQRPPDAIFRRGVGEPRLAPAPGLGERLAPRTAVPPARVVKPPRGGPPREPALTAPGTIRPGGSGSRGRGPGR